MSSSASRTSQNSFGEQVVHKDVNLEVRRGEILGVVGGFGDGQVGADAFDHRASAIADAGEIRRPRRAMSPTSTPPPRRTSAAAMGRAVPERRAVLVAHRRREYRGTDARVLRPRPDGLMDEIASYKIAMVGLPDARRAEVSHPSCRAACASVRVSRARWRSTRSCCSSTSRPPGLIRSARRRSTS